ncbi:MAG: bifunctional folylpolyglutamate synthase/dihydrofolate synthase [Deltaproteobacteria bacterium]|jgi:dihydrofolate synthase/folylpolyglutamate synthase|nr:bifunctional folylpolyglutamate synthase/dihydrofolate synthase [Deltaproteobacteria bacterium]
MAEGSIRDEYRNNVAKLFELQKFGMKFGLESMFRILDKLGQPQEGLKCVHLAGTNGKGSTAAMLAEGLKLCGYNVGLYTSPHLITFRERIQINGQYISEGEVVDLVNQVWPATDPKSPPTFFEFVTAMAFSYFRRQGVDLAIVETGLGGRLDSTNVIFPLVSAITNVSLEHTEHLGTTIEAIAYEKAGVIKPGTPFVGGRLTGKALEIVSDRAKEFKCPTVAIMGRDYGATRLPGPGGQALNGHTQGGQALNGHTQAGHSSGGLAWDVHAIDYRGPRWELKNVKVALSGPYQDDNAAMALALAETLESLGYRLDPFTMARGLETVKWPGRAETFSPGAWPPGGSSAAPLLLDGAHNPAGAAALAEHLKIVPRRKLHLIVGVMADKDVAGVLSPVLALADRLYLTRPAYHRAADPETLLSRLSGALGPPQCPHTLHPTIPEALAAAAKEATADDLVVVCGSLFTVGETRAYLLGETDLESN